jgi:hypothetical protein
MKIPEFDKIPTVAVYQKRTNGNYYMLVTEKDVDTVNNAHARKPLIEHKYKIIELGVGASFIETWSKKYKIKSFEQK